MSESQIELRASIGDPLEVVKKDLFIRGSKSGVVEISNGGRRYRVILDVPVGCLGVLWFGVGETLEKALLDCLVTTRKAQWKTGRALSVLNDFIDDMAAEVEA